MYFLGFWWGCTHHFLKRPALPAAAAHKTHQSNLLRMKSLERNCVPYLYMGVLRVLLDLRRGSKSGGGIEID